MDYENIDVTDILAAGGGAGYDYEAKADNEGGAGGDAAGGKRGHWGYGGTDAIPNEADVFAVDDDDDDDAEEPVDLEHELPAFANAANRELNSAVISAEKQLHSQQAAVKESQDRVVVMKEHLRNVVLEIAHTQKLLESKTKEVSTEEHLKQLAEREVGRIRQEMRRLDTDADDIREALNNVQNGIFKGSERLEQFKVGGRGGAEFYVASAQPIV